MKFSGKRMEREADTIRAMIKIYCRQRHGSSEKLCPDCAELRAYANKRLQNCPFQEKKSTCGKCLVHCYKPGMRTKTRKVMAHVGPQMMRYHPLMGIRHLLDGLRKAPKIIKKEQRRD